jgi:hypothetical protein
MDRSWIDVQNEVHERAAGTTGSGHFVRNRGTRSLVSCPALPLRVWSGDSIKFAPGRFSALGPRHPEARGSDSKPIDPKDGGMLFTFLLEKRQSGLVPEARFS